MTCAADVEIAVRTKLVASDLDVTFERGGAPVNVLQNNTLEVSEGEFVCILGPSGGCKSRLLYVIGGFLKPTVGEVMIDGEPVRGPDPRRISVFQERRVFPWLTVEGNIGFGLSRLSPAERADRIGHYVKLGGLRGFEKAYPLEFSGGTNQRLEVARALAVDPDLLFLDETFGALDSITRLILRGSCCASGKPRKKPSCS